MFNNHLSAKNRTVSLQQYKARTVNPFQNDTTARPRSAQQIGDAVGSSTSADSAHSNLIGFRGSARAHGPSQTKHAIPY